jgi:serine/threonine protein phosphatase 1
MTMQARTFAIGDIHGNLVHLDALFRALPELRETDTVVFIGDYVDRGPDSKGVVARVRALASTGPARVVWLRGNHEDQWVVSTRGPNPAFLFPPGNGCGQMYRSFTGGPPLEPGEALGPIELSAMFEVGKWLPADVIEWMDSLPLWYEDEHAIYVHAGLADGGDGWAHPREGASTSLLWQRDRDFFRSYEGKRVVFGHTPVELLPVDHLGFLASLFDDPHDVWKRGHLVGVDTGCGKGGFLSAIELPSGKVYESR